MELIHLTPSDLSIPALLVLALAALSWRLRLGVERQLLIAALRSILQLLLLGLVLNTLFSQRAPLPILALALFMLLVAGYEVMARQKRRFRGPWGIGIGTLSMFISSFSITLLAVHLVVRVDPWYTPQYLIPLLGMLLGNTMSGMAIALDNLTHDAWQQRGVIEAQLMLGENWDRAIREIRRDALRSGLIPIINAMAAAGVVSLPGMMTGQILAGNPPLQAVQYQIVVMFMLAGATALGCIGTALLAYRRLFNAKHQLRAELITKT